jgi:hypothetical protein
MYYLAMDIFSGLIWLGKAGAMICVLYCFFQWLDPVAKYLEHEDKLIRNVGFAIFIVGMIWIFGSISEIPTPLN